MLTQDYVRWVVIGAIDSTTDQLLCAHVCLCEEWIGYESFYFTDMHKKKAITRLLFITTKLELSHEIFQPSFKLCTLLWMP
ncbi:hypothetical protein CU280_15330 [Yersinia mollaretii]|nr:hypothetical protein CU280_15330 [Yersinia mollaretii]